MSVSINLIDATPMVAVSVVLGNMVQAMDYKTLVRNTGLVPRL